MAKLIMEHSGEEFDIEDDSPITQECEEAGIPFGCTEGVCGTCTIEVVQGMENLNPPTQQELDFLGDDTSKERLACQCRLKCGSVTIRY